MQRTGLSIAGGVLLLVCSILIGIGGAGVLMLSNPAFAEKLKADVEKTGKLKPEQKKQFDEMIAMYAQPSVKRHGYFAILAALVGFVGGIGLLTATAFGRTSGALGAALGIATCLWSMALFGVGAIIVQGIFLILYVLALAGAMSLKPKEAAGALP